MFFDFNRVYRLHARLLRLIQAEKFGEGDPELMAYFIFALVIVRTIEEKIRYESTPDAADVRFIIDLEKLLL